MGTRKREREGRKKIKNRKNNNGVEEGGKLEISHRVAFDDAYCMRAHARRATNASYTLTVLGDVARGRG